MPRSHERGVCSAEAAERSSSAPYSGECLLSRTAARELRYRVFRWRAPSHAQSAAGVRRDCPTGQARRTRIDMDVFQEVQPLPRRDGVGLAGDAPSADQADLGDGLRYVAVLLAALPSRFGVQGGLQTEVMAMEVGAAHEAVVHSAAPV